MKPFVFGGVAAVIVWIGAWLFGADLSHRGFELGTTFVVSIAMFVVVCGAVAEIVEDLRKERQREDEE